MFKYILGNNIIITTKERYEKEFKEMGYTPFLEEKKQPTIEFQKKAPASKK